MKNIPSLLKSGIKHSKELFFKYWQLLVIIILAVLCIFLYFKKQEVIQEPTIVKQEQLKNTDEIKKELHVTKEQAQDIQQGIEHKGKPKVSYYVNANNVEQGAVEVQKQIKNNADIPKEAKEKTDRTVVVPNKEEQKVDVYKINLRKDTKIKAGMTVVNEKVYPTIGVEHKRIEALYHVGGGVSVMYTVAQW